MKLLYSSYEQYSAFAVATDLGINWYDPETDWSFSAVVANLGGQLKKFHESYDRLPIDVRLGATKGACPPVGNPLESYEMETPLL